MQQPRDIMFCKVKRQYLLTFKVSRYCILALHGSIISPRIGDVEITNACYYNNKGF